MLVVDRRELGGESFVVAHGSHALLIQNRNDSHAGLDQTQGSLVVRKGDRLPRDPFLRLWIVGAKREL